MPDGITRPKFYGDVFFKGTAATYDFFYDASAGDFLPGTDDFLIAWGNGTLSFDFQTFGNIATAYRYWDASASEDRNYGPVRETSKKTCLSKRLELEWVAGSEGLPALNAVVNANPTDGTIFAAATLASRMFEILGTNAVTSTSAHYVEGGIVLTTTTGAADSVILVPHLDDTSGKVSPWSAWTWGTDQETEWECHIGTDGTITNEVIWAGLKLTNTATKTTDADQVFFRFAPSVNSGKWEAISAIGDADVDTDTGVTVAVSTNYHMKITIDSSRIARFYLDGVLVKTSAALTNAIDLIPYIGILNSSGAAHAVRIYGQTISRKF